VLSSSFEEVSWPKPRLLRRSEIVSLFVVDEDVSKFVELLEGEAGLVTGIVVFVKTLFTCRGK
jgi:hypothetical protein